MGGVYLYSGCGSGNARGRGLRAVSIVSRRVRTGGSVIVAGEMGGLLSLVFRQRRKLEWDESEGSVTFV